MPESAIRGLNDHQVRYNVDGSSPLVGSADHHGHQAPSHRRPSDERADPAAVDACVRQRRAPLRPPQVSQVSDPVTEAARRDAEEPPVKWLTVAKLDSWLSVVRLMTWLPWSIDQQLQRDSNLGMVEYQVMAMLSQSPERRVRMSSLAEVTNASLSRLWLSDRCGKGQAGPRSTRRWRAARTSSIPDRERRFRGPQGSTASPQRKLDQKTLIGKEPRWTSD
jgi:hypothetical protein